MSACEKCWSEANSRSLLEGGSVSQHYQAILEERWKSGELCTPREQAGQWWDEERQRDSRFQVSG
jgi:hypothetical protein